MVLSGDHQIPIKIPSAATALSLLRRKFPFLTLFIDNFNVFHEIQQDKSVSKIIFHVFLLVLRITANPPDLRADFPSSIFGTKYQPKFQPRSVPNTQSLPHAARPRLELKPQNI